MYTLFLETTFSQRKVKKKKKFRFQQALGIYEYQRLNKQDIKYEIFFIKTKYKKVKPLTSE